MNNSKIIVFSFLMALLVVILHCTSAISRYNDFEPLQGN